MPTKRLPQNPDLKHLQSQARDLLKDLRAQDPAAAQRMREFHPQLANATDEEVLNRQTRHSEALLAIAREYGFPNWEVLKAHVEDPNRQDISKPHHVRITHPELKRAVELLDAGDAEGLRVHLAGHKGLVDRRADFVGENYFRKPTVLEFIAENPVRHNSLPANIVEIAQVILDAGPKAEAIQSTLGLVVSGRVAREQGVQTPLIKLLCAAGADPVLALPAALAHGEFEAVAALLQQGAIMTLSTAAALDHTESLRALLPGAEPEELQAGLMYAAMFGHTEVVRLLLEAGADPNQYGPLGLHSHSTPLHQAAWAGHVEAAELLIKAGADQSRVDLIHKGTPFDWACHAGQQAMIALLESSSL